MSESATRLGVSATEQAELPRVLGLMDVVGILIGTVIGSGIFIVPAAMAGYTKSPVLLLSVWIVGGVLSFFGALAFSELGAAFPQAGGMYVFLREAYGRPVAFLFGWTLFFVIDSGSIAALSMAFASKYLPQFVALSPAGIKAAAAIFIASLAGINYAGTRWGARVQNLLMFIKFGAILAVTGALLFSGRGSMDNLVSPPAGPMSGALVGGFGLALVASLWAYKGWEVVSFSAGEIKNPERNIPLGLLAGMAVVIVLYMATNVAYLYILPVGQIATSSRVASDAMQIAVGATAAWLIGFVTLFSITGAANGNVLTAPRVFFAMARDGLFFKSFGKVHPKALTPYVSIMFTGAWAICLSLSGTFEQLASYVIFGQWIFFGLTVAAVIVLRRKRPDLPRPYRTWGYPVTPVIFVMASLYICVNALINSFTNAIIGLGIILLGVPAYMYWNRKA